MVGGGIDGSTPLAPGNGNAQGVLTFLWARGRQHRPPSVQPRAPWQDRLMAQSYKYGGVATDKEVNVSNSIYTKLTPLP
jgi:hypothetical protein